MSAPKPPCACRHFHGLHIPAAARAGRCTGPGCDCQAYTRPTRLPDERLRPEEYTGEPDASAPAVAGLAVPDDGPSGAGVGDLAVIPEWADEWAPGVTCCGKPAVRVQAYNGTWHTACSLSGWGIEKCPAERAERDD